jgi:hypothetical protein
VIFNASDHGLKAGIEIGRTQQFGKAHACLMNATLGGASGAAANCSRCPVAAAIAVPGNNSIPIRELPRHLVDLLK